VRRRGSLQSIGAYAPPLTKLEDIVAKPDHLADLERRQKFLEDEISSATPYYPGDDLMIGDLKRRLLHLRNELDRLYHVGAVRQCLH
jgi:hypothetical protein